MEERELPEGDEVARLEDLAAREFSIWGDPGFRFSKTEQPTDIDLVPKALHGKGGGTIGRFHRLEAVDPLRTETLCYLATRDTLKWLAQHYPAEKLKSMRDAGGYVPPQRARYVEKQLERTTPERELHCLLNRHPDSRERIEQLIATITREEIEAFRRVLGLNLFDFPHRS